MFVRLLLATVITLFGTHSYAVDLAEVYQQALENDQQIAAAIAERRASRYEKMVVRGDLLPQASVSYEASRVSTEVPADPLATDDENEDVEFDSSSLSIRLAMPLLDVPAIYRYQASRRADTAAELQLFSSEQQLIRRVISAYFDVLRAEDNLRSSVAESRALKGSLERLQRGFELGANSIIEVQEAKARFDLAKVQELNLKSMIQVNREALTVITGQSAPELMPLDSFSKMQSLSPNTVDDWVAMALANSPQLAIGKQQGEQLRLQRNAVSATRLPTVNLFAEHSQSQRAPFTAGQSTTETVSQVIGLQFSLPIFTGGKLYGQTKQITEELTVSELQLKQQQRQLEQQVRSDFYRLTNDLANIQARRVAVESATTALKATEAGFLLGSRNVIELLNAQSSLFQAERDYANARYDYIHGLVQIKANSGVLAATDIQQLNRLLGTRSSD